MMKVQPKIGGVFILDGEHKTNMMIAMVRDKIFAGNGAYHVNCVQVATGMYGSPMHAKTAVVFVWRVNTKDPTDVFGKIFADTCRHVQDILAAVPDDFRRCWTVLHANSEEKDTVDDVKVSQLLQDMKESGKLPHHFARAGLTAIEGARTSLAVARMEALQWWMVEQGKDFGLVDVEGKHGIVYLDGSFPGKQKKMVVAQKDGHGHIVFRVLTLVELFAILAYDLGAYNISVSMSCIRGTLSASVPVPLVFAAVMSAASASGA